jgi:hypothetical protein
VQTTGFAPTQAPDWQVSVCVQAFPSEQAEASARMVNVPVTVFVKPCESVTLTEIVCGPTPRPSVAC